jgi:LDH2 family malate/lactate/ureidoglycolate dehydrogenase
LSTTLTHRYRLDDLRRFATALGSAGGLPLARAQGLANHLLWYDAAGAAFFGIGTLPVWLAAIEAQRVDPKVVGEVKSERGALTVVDGQRGLPPLVLERGAGLAVEKAREMGWRWSGSPTSIESGRRRPSRPVSRQVRSPDSSWARGIC